LVTTISSKWTYILKQMEYVLTTFPFPKRKKHYSLLKFNVFLWWKANKRENESE